MSVIKDLKFPNGDILETTYTCHLYANEKFVDKVMVSEYKDIEVTDVTYRIEPEGQNIQIIIYFNYVR
jgi:hypothetical protein